MSIKIDLNATHHVVAASSHTYINSTQPVDISRTLAHHDIIYIVEGEWQFFEYINGKTVEYLLKQDDILFLAAGHHYFTKMPCKPNTKTMSINITREGKDLSDEIRNALTIETHFSCSSNNQIAKFFKDTCDAFWQDDQFSQSRADAYATLLLCEIGKIGKIRTYSSEVKNAIRIINDHVYKSTSENNFQEEIIEASGLSYKKILSLFKDETGYTIHSYLMNMKLEAVASQIEMDPNIRLKELASMFDFYDEFYLSKLFKKKFGYSPVEYKKSKLNRRTRYDTIC